MSNKSSIHNNYRYKNTSQAYLLVVHVNVTVAIELQFNVGNKIVSVIVYGTRLNGGIWQCMRLYLSSLREPYWI